jgi:ferric-dicitrate binding protein FerR (iron transport regulator)
MARVVGSLSVLGLLWAALPGVCPAQVFQTDSASAAAVVVSMTGQVDVFRDSQPWALNVGSEVKPKQIIQTGPDGYAKFKVSDGSTFEVFPSSRVTFRSTPGDWKDLLEMWLGRVKVHIEHLNGQPNPNKVRTPTAIISVRGTTFDVQMEEDDATLVSVDEGLVDVRHRLIGGREKLVPAGEWIRVYRNVPLAQKTLDRTNVIRGALRAAADAIYTTIYRSPGGVSGGSVPAGGGTSGGGGLPGDHGGGKTPTPPPTKTGGGDAGPGAPPPPPGN